MHKDGSFCSQKAERKLSSSWNSLLVRRDSMRAFQALLENSQLDGRLFHCFRRFHGNPEDLIYELFKLPNKQEASIGKLIKVLKSYGLYPNSDPRLLPMMERIRAIESQFEEQDKEAKDPKHWKLSDTDFRQCIQGPGLLLIERTLRNDLIVPSWAFFCDIIRDIFGQCALVRAGKVADYIPQLARVDPGRWGLAICTIDGQRFALGDSKCAFCLQSVSKAFTYAIAASELGADVVHQFVGQEPSGRLFNEICLDPKNKPHNPMVNSGAIVVTTLIQNKMNLADRFDYILDQYRGIAGGLYVGFNNAVFLSERISSDRNFALSYYMKEYKCFPKETGSLQEALDFYFQLCSLEANCESAAVMAATLANGGVCPLTEKHCIQSRPCRDVLSLMYSCGMYDYSGQFAFHVGLPAKSGVSGAMVVVVPNLMGICLWSPPLDEMGNSCRGVAFCKEMINRFNFHNYDSLAHTELSKFDPRRRLGELERDQVVALLFAAKAGDLHTVRRIWMQGGDLERSDYDKRTALHLAASEGHANLVKFLLNVGRVRPEPRDRWHRTPKEDAETFGYQTIAQILAKAAQQKSTAGDGRGQSADEEQQQREEGRKWPSDSSAEEGGEMRGNEADKPGEQSKRTLLTGKSGSSSQEEEEGNGGEDREQREQPEKGENDDRGTRGKGSGEQAQLLRLGEDKGTKLFFI